MKILKEGTPATAVISCPHCRCEMEYTNKDMCEAITYNDGNSYLAAYPTKRLITFYIKCPCCGEHITVSKL